MGDGRVTCTRYYVLGIRLMYGVLGTYSFAARPARWWPVPPCGHAMINKGTYTYSLAPYHPTTLPPFHPVPFDPSTLPPVRWKRIRRLYRRVPFSIPHGDKPKRTRPPKPASLDAGQRKLRC